jgi:hypothetical protein
MFDAPPITHGTPPSGLPRRKRDQLRRRAAWGLSAILHALASAAVAAEIAVGLFIVPGAGDSRQIEIASLREPVSLEATLTTLPIELPPDPTAAMVAEVQIARLAAEQLGPQLAAQLLDSPSSDGQSLAAQWAQARVQQEIANAENTTAEQQFQRLERLTSTLDDIATDESVKEASARLAQLLSAKPRATEPAAERPPGEFDLNTAQLYDVKRSDNGRGGYSYAAILLDAEGRTLESALTEAEGEQLFRTFELMKANPLLARVYRGVVMSLLDKLLRPASGQPPADAPLDK